MNIKTVAMGYSVLWERELLTTLAGHSDSAFSYRGREKSGEKEGPSDIFCLSKHLEQFFFKHFGLVKIQTALCQSSFA